MTAPQKKKKPQYDYRSYKEKPSRRVHISSKTSLDIHRAGGYKSPAQKLLPSGIEPLSTAPEAIVLSIIL